MNRLPTSSKVYIVLMLTLAPIFILHAVNMLINKPSEYQAINLLNIFNIVLWSFNIQQCVRFMNNWSRPETTRTWCTEDEKTCFRMLRNGTPIAFLVERKPKHDLH